MVAMDGESGALLQPGRNPQPAQGGRTPAAPRFRAEGAQRAREAVCNASSCTWPLTECACRQGASVEQMAIEVNKKRTALETARKDLKIMLQLNKVRAE